MKEFVEKLIERLEAQPTEQFVGKYGNHELVSTVIDCCVECVNQLAEEYNPPKTKSLDNGWIPCIERLPEKPDIQYQALEYFPEYNVTIDGAEKSTTLLYLGDGEWSDSEGNSYNVIAWQPLPSPYKPEEKPEKPQTNFYSERFNRVN